MRKVSPSIKYGLHVVAFIFTVSGAVASYVNSTFINSLVNIKFVGLIFSISAIISILFFALLPRILPRIGNLAMLIGIIGLDSLALYLLGTSSDSTTLLVSIISHISLITIVIFSLDIFMEHSSLNKSTGSARASFLTILNLGWLVSPFISGTMVDKLGVTTVYQFSFFLGLLVIAILLLCMRKFKDKKYKTISVGKVIKTLKKNKSVRLIFLSSFLLNFFFSIMVIYAPIYLNKTIGFSFSQIGIIFTVMLLPFVLFEIPLGRLADGRIGEKEILRAGFLIAGLATFLFSLVDYGGIIFYAIVLFATRTGAAMIEIMTETYFFKHVGEKDSSMIAAFRNIAPFAYIVAPIIAILLFTLDSYSLIFGVLAAVMISGYYLTEKIVDTK